MRGKSQIKIKKLAFAYGTGWEYIPEGEEAGSVLTDIFLDMAEENRERYEQVWRKHELEFQKALPERENGAVTFAGALAVKVSGEEHGKWLEEGSEAYPLREQGLSVRFQTIRSLQLTAAKLRYAVYERGLCAWLTYEEGEQSALTLFRQGGQELTRPVFRWFFQGLCDGREDFSFEAVFLDRSDRSLLPAAASGEREEELCDRSLLPVAASGEKEEELCDRSLLPAAALGGKWTILCGETLCPAEWRRTDSGFRLEGTASAFAANLEKEMYEVRLEFSPEEELTEPWLTLLRGGFGLKGPAEECAPDLCVTDSGVEEGEKILPFGRFPEEACCCYLACDRILGGAEKEIRLCFRESYLTEEKLPEPPVGEYEKLYRKYPWLRQTQRVEEWQAEDTLWEYFNGNLWRPLPGSDTWKTGCHGGQERERVYTWEAPRDRKPCVVEGEMHFYIRLRLRGVRNAYAMYYRRQIPVLEGIRFSAGEYQVFPVEKEVPDCEVADAEKMYLGFDREVTPDNCWYTGAGSCSFPEEMIRGRGIRFGREAFWVELIEKREDITCLRANYVPVRGISVETEPDGDMAQDRKGDMVRLRDGDMVQIREGEAFGLEPRGMGMLEAVCLSEICCESAGAPVISGRQAGEHYFAHLGRLLTPMDLEMMLQERYPLLQVRSCIFRREADVLEVELVYTDQLERGVRNRMLRRLTIPERREEGAAMQPGKDPEQEVRDRLPEIRRWLEKLLNAEGPVWLRRCSCVLRMAENCSEGDS